MLLAKRNIRNFLNLLSSCFVLSLIFVIFPAPLSSATVSKPLGTLIWTDSESGSNDWQIKFYTYSHPDLAANVPGLNLSGTVSYGDKLNPGSTIDNPPYEEFSGGAAATDFLHPSFDYSGVRIFFASGKGITHTGAGDEMSLQMPEVKIFKYSPSAPPGTPFVEASGWNYPFHPVCDHKGEFVLYNKFKMKAESGEEAGIHLYRANYSDGGGETLVAQHAAYPSLSASDNIVVFVRQLPNEDKLPETPIAMGVYSLELDPATGKAAGDPQLLTPMLGEPFAGYVPAGAPSTPSGGGTGPDPQWRGPIRCGKACIGSDDDTVIFSLQDGRSGTCDSSWNLWKLSIDGGSTSLSPVNASGADTSAFDDYWPSLSADGKWVAHMHVIKGTETTKAQYRILVTCIDEPDKTHSPANLGAIGLWPAFDQDNDIPNLEIKLTPGNSGKTTLIRVTDIEPDEWDSGNCTDKFNLYFESSNFVPASSVDFKPSTTAVLSWSKRDLPATLNLLLSTNEVYEGDDHKSYKSFAGHLSEYDSAGGNPIEAIYLEEGSRLKIDILARDGRYLRPDSGDNNPEDFLWDTKAANYHDVSFETLNPLTTGRNVDPPYFPRVSKSAIDGSYPGVTWWVEEPDGTVASGSESALDYIFRRPNFPSSHPSYDPEHPYFIRVVAQDIWLNKIDIKIPVYIWDKKSDVKSLGFKSNKSK
jgi:hypothetical protein